MRSDLGPPGIGAPDDPGPEPSDFVIKVRDLLDRETSIPEEMKDQIEKIILDYERAIYFVPTNEMEDRPDEY